MKQKRTGLLKKASALALTLMMLVSLMAGMPVAAHAAQPEAPDSSVAPVDEPASEAPEQPEEPSSEQPEQPEEPADPGEEEPAAPSESQPPEAEPPKEENTQPQGEGITVYLDMMDSMGKYVIPDKPVRGAPQLASYPFEVAAFDLDPYGLGDYNPAGDNAGKVSLVHLLVKLTEAHYDDGVIGTDIDPYALTVSGAAGSAAVTHFWDSTIGATSNDLGFDVLVNGQPVLNSTRDARLSIDEIMLEADDRVSILQFSGGSIGMPMHHDFMKVPQISLGCAESEVKAWAGIPISIGSATYAQLFVNMPEGGVFPSAPMANAKLVYYKSENGSHPTSMEDWKAASMQPAEGTDSSGAATLYFSEPGTYYLSTTGSNNFMAPATLKLEVLENTDPKTQVSFAFTYNETPLAGDYTVKLANEYGQSAQADGDTIGVLPGTYSYVVSFMGMVNGQQRPLSATGEVTVTDTAQTVTLPLHTVSFEVTDATNGYNLPVEEPVIVIVDVNGTRSTYQGGEWPLLAKGSYSYQAGRALHGTFRTGTLTIDGADQTVAVDVEDRAPMTAFKLYDSSYVGYNSIAEPAFEAATHEYSLMAPEKTNVPAINAKAAGATRITARFINLVNGEAASKELVHGTDTRPNATGVTFLNSSSKDNDLWIDVEEADNYLTTYYFDVHRDRTLYCTGSLSNIGIEIINNGDKIQMPAEMAAADPNNKGIYGLNKTFDYALPITGYPDTVELRLQPTHASYSMVVKKGDSILDGTKEGNFFSYEVPVVKGRNKLTVDISLEADDWPTPTTYNLDILSTEAVGVEFNLSTDPEAAGAKPIIQVLDYRNKLQTARESDIAAGRFEYDLLKWVEYSYSASIYGYTAATGTVTPTGEGDVVDVVLRKNNTPKLPDVGSQWPNFRGNDENNGITDIRTPATSSDLVLSWASKYGGSRIPGQPKDDWANTCTPPIIVGDHLVFASGYSLVKLNRMTGEEVMKKSVMAADAEYTLIPPTYVPQEGMILMGLRGGRVQAFNANTLESLWVYTDPLGGQPNTTITYRDGYLYTGFWTGEEKDANFVCLSATDEDPGQNREKKHATWSYTHKGGFYWAGAYADPEGRFILVGADNGMPESDVTTPGTLYSFDPLTGEMLDKNTEVKGDLRTSITYADGCYYYGANGGSLNKASMNADGTIASVQQLGGLGGKVTSTPVVYGGRAYVGSAGGGIRVIDVATMSLIYTAASDKSQASGLLTTGYSTGGDGTVYVYFQGNTANSKIFCLKDKPGQTSGTVTTLFEPLSPHGQFATTSLITDDAGTLYFRNDTGFMMALSHKIDHLELVKAPEKTRYDAGDVFDPTGMVVHAVYKDGAAPPRDVTDYLSFSTAPLTGTEANVYVSFEHMLYDGEGTRYENPNQFPRVAVPIVFNDPTTTPDSIHIINADGEPAPTLELSTLGAPARLRYALVPEDASTGVVWTSSNPAVATVARQATGAAVVTPQGPGSTVITLSSTRGNLTDSCTVTVTAPSLSLDKPGIKLEAVSGAPAVLNATQSADFELDWLLYEAADRTTALDKADNDYLTGALAGTALTLTPIGKAGAVVVRVYAKDYPALYAECPVTLNGSTGDYAQLHLDTTSVTAYTTQSTGTAQISLRRDPGARQLSLHDSGVELRFATEANQTLVRFEPAAGQEDLVNLVLTAEGAKKVGKTIKGKLEVVLPGRDPMAISQQLSVKVSGGAPALKGTAITINTFQTNRLSAKISITGAELEPTLALNSKTSASVKKWLETDKIATDGTVSVKSGTKKSGTLYVDATLANYKDTEGNKLTVRVPVKVTASYGAPSLKLSASKATLYGGGHPSTGGTQLKLLPKKSGQSLESLAITGIRVAVDGTDSFNANTYKQQANFFVKNNEVREDGSFTLGLTAKGQNDAANGKVLLLAQVAGTTNTVSLPVSVTVTRKTTKISLKAPAGTITLNPNLKGTPGGETYVLPITTSQPGFNLVAYQAENPAQAMRCGIYATKDKKYTTDLNGTAHVPSAQVFTDAKGSWLKLSIPGDAEACGKAYKLRLVLPGVNWDAKKEEAVDSTLVLNLKTTAQNAASGKNATKYDPKVSFSASGKLDLTTGAAATIKAKFSNYLGVYDTGAAPAFEVVGWPGGLAKKSKDAAEIARITALFSFEPVAGTNEVKVRWNGDADKPLYPGSYTLKQRADGPGAVNGGMAGPLSAKTFKLTVSATKPKVTVAPAGLQFYNNNPGCSGTLAFTLPAGTAPLDRVEIKGSGGSYALDKDFEGNYIITYSKATRDDAAKLKKAAGKTLSLNVYLEGNSKAATTVKVKVSVKKLAK